MTATVFISHSCKDNEETPPADLSPEQLEARAVRLAYARTIRDRVEERLRHPRDGERAFTVFLDVRGGLSAGDVWRDELHLALRTCDGGVILLTPDSIASGWVLKEATILSWRVFENDGVLVIPIVVGVSDKDLSNSGFGPLDLDQIQWVRIEPGSDLASKIDDVVAALARIPADPLSSDERLSRTERWIMNFAGQLAHAVQGRLANDSLQRMFEAVEIRPIERGQLGEDPYVALARQALLATGGQIVRMLNRAGHPNQSQREEMRAAASMMWVGATPAAHLLLAARARKVVAVDTTESRSLREYVLRACCNDVDADRIVEPSHVTGGTDAEAIATITSALGLLHPIENPARVEADVMKYGPIFVLLGPGLARPSVLDAMTRDFPQFTYVAAVGPDPRRTLRHWANRVVLLQPRLQPDREVDAVRFRNRLKQFVDGRLPT